MINVGDVYSFLGKYSIEIFSVSDRIVEFEIVSSCYDNDELVGQYNHYSRGSFDESLKAGIYEKVES